MSDYPHVPAAFINAIAEEGTKAEAIEYLQKQWNENCALRALVERQKTALEEISDLYAGSYGYRARGIATKALSLEASEKSGKRWVKLPTTVRIRPGPCTTDYCLARPAWRLEAGGVGSDYCSDCKAKIDGHSAVTSDER